MGESGNRGSLIGSVDPPRFLVDRSTRPTRFEVD
jgi:hypothetical protein